MAVCNVNRLHTVRECIQAIVDNCRIQKEVMADEYMSYPEKERILSNLDKNLIAFIGRKNFLVEQLCERRT